MQILVMKELCTELCLRSKLQHSIDDLSCSLLILTQSPVPLVEAVLQACQNGLCRMVFRWSCRCCARYLPSDKFSTFQARCRASHPDVACRQDRATEDYLPRRTAQGTGTPHALYMYFNQTMVDHAVLALFCGRVLTHVALKFSFSM